ncbi:hypothetical protein FS837_006822 [Tulasnella sp. UAMH 9824]|nr:hypothetical protein FS837_006822 [Tulasnella sp. UAMH 9824]
MLDDILWNSDGFGVVDSLLLRSGIKDWWKKDRHSSSSTYPFTVYSYHNHSNIDNTPTAYLIIDTDPLEDMSLTRQLFNEFRPFFRMFDDAAFRPFAVQPSRRFRAHEFEDPFESLFSRSSPFGGRTARVDLKEEGNNYVIEAEVPGVKKENLDVTVGDHGRSITIEGRVFGRSADSQQPQSAGDATNASESAASQAVEGGASSSSSTVLTQQQQGGTEVSTNVGGQHQQPQWETRSSFSRTIWLPRPVDSSKVSGKLEDGVLRLEIPKMAEEEAGRTRINVQ